MIPKLFPADVPEALFGSGGDRLLGSGAVELFARGDDILRSFSSFGIGTLSDAISCEVTEERNGEYKLTMKYPRTGQHFADIVDRAIIVAKPNYTDSAQAFRIQKITKPINGVITVNAVHISQDLTGVPVLPFTATSAATACAGLMSHAAVANPFTITTDKSTSASFKVDVPSSVRSWFGGKEGSLIDTFGGEWHYNNYTCMLEDSRGTDRGVVIRYGKNLIDIKQERNIANVYTGVLPYWYDDETDTLVKATQISVSGNYNFSRVLCLDLSDDFENQPSTSQLISRANRYISANNIGTPKVSLKLDWAQSTDRVDLCDTVTVKFEELGISARAKCISATWDVLKDRYSEIEIGDAKSNIADTIVSLQVEDKKIGTVSNRMVRAINNATALITGNEGGYVVMHTDASGTPYEILVMNEPEIANATKVWRWNQAGFGYSSNGYNGPYGVAITMDGSIVANYITSGSLSADRISGGTIDATDVTITNLDASNITSGTLSADRIGAGSITSGKLESSIITSINTAQATADSANSQEQLIYISKPSGTTSQAATTTWITSTANTQNAWRARRPTYNASYPVLFVATQRKAVDGTVTCTTPVIDQTTTVIDGGHITTGTIDASVVNVTNLNADQLTSGTISSVNIDIDTTNITNGIKLKNTAGTTYTQLTAATLRRYVNGTLVLNMLNGGITANGAISFPSVYSTTTSGGSTVRVDGAGSLMRYVSSSKRYKHDITEELDEDPEKLYELTVKQFKYNKDYLSEDDQRAGKNVLGFIAEEVAEVMPGAVDYDEEGRPEMWNVHVVVPAMLKLIQNQKHEIDELRARLDRLEARFLDDGR